MPVARNKRNHRFRLQLEQIEPRLLLIYSSHTFALELFPANVDSPRSFQISDVTGDGQSDIVVNEASRTFLLEADAANLSPAATFDGTSTATSLVDVDGDQDLDWVSISPSEGVTLHRNLGDGRFQGRELPIANANANVLETLMIGDFDNDADVDLLMTLQNGDLELYENRDGFGEFGLKQRFQALREGPTELALADLDGDEDLDLVLTSELGIEIFENIDGSFADSGGLFGTPYAVSHPRLADFDRDGDSDLIVQGKMVDTTELLLFENTERGFVEPQSLWTVASDQILENIDVGDPDKDIDIDILVSLSSDGEGASIAWLENSDGRGQFFDLATVSRNARLVSVDDANDDHVDDLLIITDDGKLGAMDYRLAGDTNRDGFFDSSDIIQVFGSGHYEDGLPLNSTFAEGDWNGDREFTSADLITALQAGTFDSTTYPRLFFGPSDIPDLREKLENPIRARKFESEKQRVMDWLEVDFSDPKMSELDKAKYAHRFAFVTLMLEKQDPDRIRIAAKARNILLNINNGTWPGYASALPVHKVDWNREDDLHPWHGGGILMDYSLAFDWLAGSGELNGRERDDVRFRILRLAQLEHNRQRTPFHLVRPTTRTSNYVFRSLGGVGLAALTFPNQEGPIQDPYNRIALENQTDMNTGEILSWITRELFHEITTAAPNQPTDGQSLVEHYFSSDGVYGEGFTYEVDALGTLIPFLISYRDNFGVDYLSEDGPSDGRIGRVFDTNFKVMLPNIDRPLTGDAWHGKSYLWHELMAEYGENAGAHYWYADFVGTPHFGISLSAYDDAIQKELPNYRTEFLPDAGFAVFRDKWGPDATYLMLIAEDRPVFGHNQADQGSLVLYAHGAYLVIDPGYGRAYGRDPEHRGIEHGGKWSWMSSALGHSGVTIDSLYTVDNAPEANLLREVIHPAVSKSYVEVSDPASIENTLAARDIDYAEAHVVYEEKRSKLERSIAFPRHRYFIVEDQLQADTVHDYGWQLQLGSTETGSLYGGNQDFLWTTPNRFGNDVNLGITMLDNHRNVNVYDNGPTNYTGTRFPDDVYDRTYILADQKAEDTRFVTILDPHENTEDQLDIDAIEEGVAWRVEHSSTSYDLIISQSANDLIHVEEIRTDANFVVVSIDVTEGQKNVISILARDGTSLEIDYDLSQVFQIDAESLLHFEAPQ